MIQTSFPACASELGRIVCAWNLNNIAPSPSCPSTTKMLTLLRELQRVWKLDGDRSCEAATVANAARLLGETLDGVETEGDLNTVWEDPHGVRCPPPPPSMRPSAAEVSAQCPMLITLATLLLKNEVFEALPWKAPGHSAQMAEGFSKAMGRELKLKSAMPCSSATRGSGHSLKVRLSEVLRGRHAPRPRRLLPSTLP